MRLIAAICACCAALLAPERGLSRGENGVRDVVIVVTVQSAANAKVVGAIVGVNVPSLGYNAGLTDADGVARISVAVAPEGGTVFVSLADEADSFNASDPAAAAAVYATAVAESHFRWAYPVAVDNDDTEVAFTMQGAECVSVSLHAPESETRQLLSAECYPAAPMPEDAQLKSDLVVKGVAKGLPAMLVVFPTLRPNVKVIELSASETLVNRDITDVEVLPHSGSEEVQVRFSDRGQMIKRPFTASSLVTLIKTDLSTCCIYVSQVKDSGLLVSLSTALPKLDPGRYAIVPGSLGSDYGPNAVYGRIKATGQVPDGVPYIDVVAGGRNSVVVSAVAAREASVALPSFPQ